MNLPYSSPMNAPISTETTLQKERKLFDELFSRLINATINRVFDLRPKHAVQRMQYLVFLFLLSVLLITLLHEEYSLRVWAQYIQNIFLYLFNPAFANAFTVNPIAEFVDFAVRALTDPRILQYLPIFLASFFIALQSAALYLADIFELEDVKVARDFIWEVALTGSDETIRIKEGEISEEHRQSSNYLIGGPGKVIVDVDSVALFEEPDGTPHVIGPTGRQPGGKATLDGFERFRQAIDIRDHYVDLRDQDTRSQSVRGRSLDGLPVIATDVRLMFSVYRGENPRRTDQFPYPFSEEAVKQIVYGAFSRVTPDQLNPSAYEFSWVNTMIGLIRGRLGAFMSGKKLSQYLASIGIPEFERARQSEEQIAEQMQLLTQQQADEAVRKKEIKPPPEFTPRHEVKNLFSQFADEFTRQARQNGVELHWIGVGTWKTPVEIVPEMHLEAWKISQENLRKGSDEAMKMAENEAILQKMESLINSVPLDAFKEVTGSGKQSRTRPKRDQRKHDTPKETGGLLALEGMAEEGVEDLSLLVLKAFQDRTSYSSTYYEPDHESAMKLLLMEYRKQLIEAVEFMKARNESVPPKIEEAVEYLNDQSGWRHWVGG